MNKKPLKGAKITLFENGESVQSVIANALGEYEMPIDTERIMDNSNMKYYVKFELPNTVNSNNNSSLSRQGSAPTNIPNFNMLDRRRHPTWLPE